jgi:hypothetical protein
VTALMGLHYFINMLGDILMDNNIPENQLEAQLRSIKAICSDFWIDFEQFEEEIVNELAITVSSKIFTFASYDRVYQDIKKLKYLLFKDIKDSGDK